MAQINDFIAQKLAIIPEFFWIAAIIAAFVAVVFFAIKKFRKKEEKQ